MQRSWRRSVLKGDKVYVFGGWIGGYLDTCDTFNLKSNEWKSIQKLPVATSGVTATLLNKMIVLSGFNMDSCYSYNDQSFSRCLKLPGYSQKIVCDRWILSGSMLYEYKMHAWIAHNARNSLTRNLLIYNVFKKGQYLYVIDNFGFLMRIDTKSKIFEKIGLK